MRMIGEKQHKKLKNVDSISNNLEGYRLVDMSILKDLLSLLCCPEPECKETSLWKRMKERGKDYLPSSLFTVNCTTCPFSWSSHTKGAKTNQRVMEVNLSSACHEKMWYWSWWAAKILWRYEHASPGYS